MLLLANPEIFITWISVIAILIIALGLLLKKMKQPYIIGYILVGIIMGDAGFGVIQDDEMIHVFGELGIILLLFFVGMEISLPELKSQWKISLVGTSLQVLLSLGIMLFTGYFLGWDIARSVVLGFVIALSSSAIVIRILEEKNIIDSQLGKNVLSILLTQDMIIAPMLIITSLVGGESQSFGKLALLIIGTLLFIGILIYVYWKKEIRLPFSKAIEDDHEIQVFVAFFFCFGGALLSSFFGLSAALGAFIGGMVMHAGKATQWIHDTLNSFRVLFVSIFFVSIGLQMDIAFVQENFVPLLIALLAVYLTNHFVNAIILKLFSSTWKEAFLGGAMLAQIGELSFLLSSTAFGLDIIEDYAYFFTISLISITLLLSPFWIAMSERLLNIKK